MRRLHLFPLLLCVLCVPMQPARAEESPADLHTLVQGNTDFAVDLYARLRSEEGNLFCSPYSISTALAMTSAGARGPTAAQMAEVLRFRLSQPGLHAAGAELARSLNGYGLPRDYQLHVANSLWGEGELLFQDDFQKLIKAHYGCRLRPVQFSQNHEQARQQINHWVEERTNNKVQELLKKSDVTPLTRLALVNAIYFKSAWEKPFDKKLTNSAAAFRVGKEKSASVALMQQVGTFNYLEEETFQALELPYEGGDLSMVVLLPRDGASLDSFEQDLTAARLEGWLARLQAQPVAVGLPRFKIKSRFSLADTLRAMGMTLAFEPGEADFSGLTAHDQLFISAVVHQAFVDVNEEGTEAAAATAVVVSRPGPPEEPASFLADHPFVFLLRDTRTGSVLFLGRVSDPAAEVQ